MVGIFRKINIRVTPALDSQLWEKSFKIDEPHLKVTKSFKVFTIQDPPLRKAEEETTCLP